jgi:hypothetical protein
MFSVSKTTVIPSYSSAIFDPFSEKRILIRSFWNESNKNRKWEKKKEFSLKEINIIWESAKEHVYVAINQLTEFLSSKF